jgi:hypothetical protein
MKARRLGEVVALVAGLGISGAATANSVSAALVEVSWWSDAGDAMHMERFAVSPSAADSSRYEFRLPAVQLCGDGSVKPADQ